MNERQVKLGRHALGLPNQRKTSYRNHFVAGPGHDDYTDWLRMVYEGAARRQHGGQLSGGDDVFFLTKAGATLCLNPGETLDNELFPIEVKK